MDPATAKALLDGQIVLSPKGQEGALGAGPPTPEAPSFMGRGPNLARQRYISENQDEGVPLDIDTGVSGWEKMMLGFRKERDNQIKYLENKYGPGTVRVNQDDELIVRVPDLENEGKPKDLLVRPHQMKASDFMDLMSVAPEIAASIWAVRKGRMIPGIGTKKAVTEGVLGAVESETTRHGLAGAARDAITGALGAEAVGAAKDVGANIMDFGKLDAGKVLEERGKSAVTDAMIGGVTYPVARFFQWAKNPLHGYRGIVQFDAIKAQNYFRNKYGVYIPLTIGESTGAPLAGRSEVFIEKLPGGSGPIREIKAQQEAGFRKLQRILFGKEDDEALGRAAMDKLQQHTAPIAAGVEDASSALGKASQDSIEDMLSTLNPATRGVYQEQIGKGIRADIIAKRDAVKAEADRLFEAVRAAPGGEGSAFDAGALQDAFKKIKSSLPSPERTVTTPIGLFGPSGKPILSTSTEKSVAKTFVPENILNRLNEVIGMGKAKLSLSDLQQMRREVYDDIARSEGVPGLGTHYLSDMGKAITSAIDTGISKLPTGDLRAALTAANEHYKNKVVPFNRIGLTELFRQADEPGFVSDSEIIQKVLGGEKAVNNWQLMKETLSPPELVKLKAAVSDNIVNSSRIPGEGTIDAKSFQRNLYQFQNKYRSIYDDVFGPKSAELFRQARTLGIAQGDKMDEAAFRQLLNGPNPNADKLKTLIAAQREADVTFKNSVLKAVGDGTLTKESINPGDFVNKVLDGASPDEVKKIVSIIGKDPEMLQEFRGKTFEKLFRDAARNAEAGDINRIISNDKTHIASGVKMAAALKDQGFRKKIESILGDESFEDLKQYIKLQAAPEFKERSFMSAGGIAAGSQIANMERRGPIAFLSDSARNFIFAKLLTIPPLRHALTRIPGEQGALSLLLASPDFTRAAVNEFGKEGSESLFSELRRAFAMSVVSRVPKSTTPRMDRARPRPYQQQLDEIDAQRAAQ